MKTVKIARMKDGGPNGFMVRRCWPTQSKHLVVTRKVMPGTNYKQYKRLFSITHVKTGFAALSNFTSIRQAQLAAAVLGALPLKLATVTRKNSRKRAVALGPDWMKWMSLWVPVTARRDSLGGNRA